MFLPADAVVQNFVCVYTAVLIQRRFRRGFKDNHQEAANGPGTPVLPAYQ